MLFTIRKTIWTGNQSITKKTVITMFLLAPISITSKVIQPPNKNPFPYLLNWQQRCHHQRDIYNPTSPSIVGYFKIKLTTKTLNHFRFINMYLTLYSFGFFPVETRPSTFFFNSITRRTWRKHTDFVLSAIFLLSRRSPSDNIVH